MDVVDGGVDTVIFASPMVHQSELAFRLQARRYDVDIATTPMLHARLLSESESYRRQEFQTHESDKPLVAQICGHSPEEFKKAAALLKDQVSAIDINFGCPQQVARRGHYGAYLLNDISLMQRLVTALVDATSARIPVTCKMRVLDSREETVNVAEKLVESGCQVLTVHGRTIVQNKQKSGSASWERIKDVCDALRGNEDVSVVANGSVANVFDAEALASFTGASGVMSAEALLDNPAMFFRGVTLFEDNVSSLNVPGLESLKSCLFELRQSALANEYMEISSHLQKQHGTYLKPVRSHLFKLTHSSLKKSHNDIRDAFAKDRSLEGLADAACVLGDRTLHNLERAVANFNNRGTLERMQNQGKHVDTAVVSLLDDVENVLKIGSETSATRDVFESRLMPDGKATRLVKEVMRTLGRNFGTTTDEAGWYFRHERIQDIIEK